MKFLKLQFVVAGFLVMLAGGAPAADQAVKLSVKDGLGSFLADADGKALYWFMKDSPAKSACVGKCLEQWPLFFREAVAPPAGIPATDFSFITREDGKKQSTFRGYPLYYYAADTKAADTAGQGVGSSWFVIDPAVFPKPKAPGY